MSQLSKAAQAELRAIDPTQQPAWTGRVFAWPVSLAVAAALAGVIAISCAMSFALTLRGRFGGPAG